MKKNFNLKMKMIAILVLSVCFTLPVRKDSTLSSSFQLSREQLTKKDGKWHYFKPGNKIPVSELIEKNYELFNLPQGISSRVEKEDMDELGMKHYLLKLEKNGIPIEDAYYTVHYSKGGDLMHVVGKYDKSDIPMEMISPKVTGNQAFKSARDAYISSKKIASKEYEVLILDELNKFFNENNLITPYLVYYRLNKKEALKLCYRVDISSEILTTLNTVYIDASNGLVVKILDYRSNNVATVATVYNGSRNNVQVKWSGWPNSYYYLRDETNATPIETRNSAINFGCTPWGFGNLDRVYKGDLNWPINFKGNAASSHWAVQESYNVYKNIFGRYYGTFSSSGGGIAMENDYIYTYGDDDLSCGPFYEPSGTNDYIHAGQTIGTLGFEGGLDVIGHEFTHGVIYRTRGISGNLQNYDETGALAESFCDIFGEIIEYYTLGASDWINGTNIRTSFKRSLENPKDYHHYVASPVHGVDCKYYFIDSTESEYPTYRLEEDCWIGGFEGAHVDNAVQNYWFYLLAYGGNQLGVTVSGIGIGDASRIAYRNMVYYLSLGSDFEDMRQASILNASILFGECSTQYTQVMNAWAAVGVGNAGTPCLHTEISGLESLMCGEEGYYYSTVIGGSGTYSYTWYVDYDYFSNASSISLEYYPQYESENHYIYLVVTDGSLSDYDDHNVYVSQCGQGGLQSIPGNETLKFKLYPNPATASIKIEIEDDLTQDASQYSIQIIDRNGKIVLADKTNATDFTVNTSSLMKGIYSTIIKNGKKVGFAKLLIE